MKINKEGDQMASDLANNETKTPQLCVNGAYVYRYFNSNILFGRKVEQNYNTHSVKSLLAFDGGNVTGKNPFQLDAQLI